MSSSNKAMCKLCEKMVPADALNQPKPHGCSAAKSRISASAGDMKKSSKEILRDDAKTMKSHFRSLKRKA